MGDLLRLFQFAKQAPHPNAAKLYLTWYLAKEQQSRSGTFSPRSDVAPPPGLEPLSSYNIDRGYRALVSDEALAWRWPLVLE